MKTNKDDKAAVLRPIALPVLPRCDEHNRTKWAQEYDRTELELLKPHVGGPTATMGLRQLPAAWDRSIPTHTDDDERIHVPRARTTDPASSASMSGSMSRTGSPSKQRPRSAKLGLVAGSLRASPLPQKNNTAILRLLFTLLSPPLQFKSQLDLNTEGIDLRWLKTYLAGDRTPTLHTLETFRDDTADPAAISSPRSAIIVLRNGITIDDLRVKPLSHFRHLGTSENDALHQCQHHEQRRVALLGALREEYRELAVSLPLFELLDEVTAFHQSERTAFMPSPLSAEEKQKQAEIAAQRRQERVLEAEAEARRKYEQAERRREIAAQRVGEARDGRRKAATASIGALSPRAAAGDSADTSPDRAAAIAAKIERANRKRQQAALSKDQEDMEARQRALRNAHRMMKNRELVQEQQQEAEERQLARELAAKQRREAVERDVALRKQQQADQASKIAELREAARLKAQKNEEQVRAEAEARAIRAAERLDAFSSFKQSQQREAAAAEAAKRDHRLKAAQRAEELRAEERDRLRRKQEDDDRRLREMSHHKQLEVEHQRAHHRLDAEDKEFLVARQRRANAFQRLVLVSDLAEKRERAEHASLARSRGL
jgi:hypothetical protein